MYRIYCHLVVVKAISKAGRPSTAPRRMSGNTGITGPTAATTISVTVKAIAQGRTAVLISYSKSEYELEIEVHP